MNEEIYFHNDWYISNIKLYSFITFSKYIEEFDNILNVRFALPDSIYHEFLLFMENQHNSIDEIWKKIIVKTLDEKEVEEVEIKRRKRNEN